MSDQNNYPPVFAEHRLTKVDKDLKDRNKEIVRGVMLTGVGALGAVVLSKLMFTDWADSISRDMEAIIASTAIFALWGLAPTPYGPLKLIDRLGARARLKVDQKNLEQVIERANLAREQEGKTR